MASLSPAFLSPWPGRRLVDVLPEKTPKEAPVEALEEAPDISGNIGGY